MQMHWKGCPKQWSWLWVHTHTRVGKAVDTAASTLWALCRQSVLLCCPSQQVNVAPVPEQHFFHSPGRSFPSVATLWIMLHLLLKQFTFCHLYSVGTFVFCLKRAGTEQEKADHYQYWFLWNMNKTASNTESRFSTRSMKNTFCIYTNFFLLVPTTAFQLQWELLYSIKECFYGSLKLSSLVPKIHLSAATKVLLFEPQDKHTHK